MHNKTFLLELNELSIESLSGTLLHDVSFNIEAGKCLALVGESGSGKSIIALAIMDLLPKSLKIKNPEKMDEIRPLSKAMIFQEPMSALNPTMIIGDQIAEAAISVLKKSKRQAREDARDWIEKVKIEEPNASFFKYPHQLSGGQRQRVMIAMAMIMKPQLIIADEPTTALDDKVALEILKLLRDLQRENSMSMIFISHDIKAVSQISDHILVLHRGREIEYGESNKVLNFPEDPYTKGLLAARPPEVGKPRRLPTVSDFINNTLPKLEDPTPSRLGSIILEVKNLSKYFSNKSILSNVSLELREGETLGLIGASGSGKSTLAKCIIGLQSIQGGEIKYRGERIDNMTLLGRKKLAKEIQYIFQDPFSSLSPRMTIGEALLEPMEVHGLYQGRDVRNKKVEELLHSVGLDSSVLKKFPHEFSGGQRQRIGIARALVLQPKILICDESVSALDLSVQAQVLNLLNELKEQFSFSYIFISHDERVVNYMSDSVVELTTI
ncbi:MAG: Glutathione import ATP-binding protein GsiA [Owenweeksia sp. TMED14]|nr:MAG: Glutathione import ATP-binding protein GsiA [Owenweeksia sp. TMED14]